MEQHEWHEKTPDGKRFYRATHHGNQWSIISTLKTDPEWYPIPFEEVTEEVWLSLRDIVWRKYQRKRCPWERVAEIDIILGKEPEPHPR